MALELRSKECVVGTNGGQGESVMEVGVSELRHNSSPALTSRLGPTPAKPPLHLCIFIICLSSN